MEREKKELSTIHERDIDKLLENTGIKNDFLAGKLHCKFCDEIVNRENVYSFLPESGAINVICDKPECVTELLSYVEEKKKKITEK
ncbi:hypothetical protein BMS3Abin15_00174 [bacterium BMS3Abin15]|nr:hypothetical protein BMS3Abin15_00174 [bacterium BMS3Abin15]